MPDILAADPPGAGFAGRGATYQFTNEDGLHPDTACGPAACPTLQRKVNRRAARRRWVGRSFPVVCHVLNMQGFLDLNWEWQESLPIGQPPAQWPITTRHRLQVASG